jgi:hypothetical protein
LSTIFSKITIYGLFTLHFQTASNKFIPNFSSFLLSKIFTFVFLNFVFSTNSAKVLGYNSFDGLKPKSLAKTMFSIVFNLSFAVFFHSQSTTKYKLSSSFLVLYSWYLYLQSIELFSKTSIFSLEFVKIVKSFGNFLNSFHRK